MLVENKSYREINFLSKKFFFYETDQKEFSIFKGWKEYIHVREKKIHITSFM